MVEFRKFMKYEQLRQQPDNILFHENDINAPALFQKMYAVDDDIVVRSFDAEMEESRYGFREMAEIERNSKDFVVLSRDQLNALNEYLTLAYFEAK
jgi:5-formaminoimidazole-4-carboxamide-1-beta-D-ribofuranosyl 5'-monophosphate synthetase